MNNHNLQSYINYIYLIQWFPTTVPRNTCVPRDVSKCSAVKLIFDLFTLKLEFHSKIIRKKSSLCSVQFIFQSQVFREIFFQPQVFPIWKKVGNHWSMVWREVWYTPFPLFPLLTSMIWRDVIFHNPLLPPTPTHPVCIYD